MTDPDRPKLVANERAKLSATFVNNVAVAIIGSGLIAPFFVALYGITNLSAEQVRFLGSAAPGWIAIGVGLHFVGRAILGGLKE